MKRNKYYGFCKDLSNRVYMAAWGRDDCDPVAARLWAARKSVNLSVPEMAKLLRVHRTTVWRWENGTIESMSYAMILEWAKVTGASAHWLMYGGRIPDGDRYNWFVMYRACQLGGRLKSLPDSMGIVSNWGQLQKARQERERQRQEEIEDAECDRLAEIAGRR